MQCCQLLYMSCQHSLKYRIVAFSVSETILQDLDYSALMLGYDKVIVEMDVVADILFERGT